MSFFRKMSWTPRVFHEFHFNPPEHLPFWPPSSAGFKAPSPMRAVTYRAPAAPDSEKPECVVYFFGRGQGGTVEANIERWKSQFTQGGNPAVAKVQKKMIHGVPVTTIEIAGTYIATGGMATTPQKPQNDFRMLAAIAEGPGGNILIRLIGSAKSVNANLAKYDQLLSSIQAE